jgi:hypothetical protein
MHIFLLEVDKVAFVAVTFIAINVNEAMAFDNIQWISIHLHVVQGWKRIPILLCVETIGVSSTFDNIFSLMVRSLQDFGGLRLKDLGGKVVNMGCDNNIIFGGNQTNVTSQFKEKATLFTLEFIVLLTKQIYLCSFFHN